MNDAVQDLASVADGRIRDPLEVRKIIAHADEEAERQRVQLNSLDRTLASAKSAFLRGWDSGL